MKIGLTALVMFFLSNIYAGEFRCKSNKQSRPPSYNVEIRGCITSDKAPTLCDDLRLFNPAGEYMTTIQKELVNNLYAGKAFIGLNALTEDKSKTLVQLEFFGKNHKNNLLLLGLVQENGNYAYVRYTQNIACEWL